MPTLLSSSTLEQFTSFGDLLRFLRRRASLTQMELADEVGYSDTQISRLEQNLRLPDIPTIETRFVSALGLEEEAQTLAKLLDLAANVRREDAPTPGLCPYKGLDYFDEADAELFVGREALTAQLVERVLSLTSSGEAIKERFLAVVGASGSGKSSLVRAGLVPSLRWNKISADWQICVFTPTEHPLESLSGALTQEANSAAANPMLTDDMARDSRGLQIFADRRLGLKTVSRLLLVVDQFEELFALCRSEEERTSFVENLLTAASEADGPIIVVIALRADFYAHCAGYARLREALSKQQQYIGAMTDDELRRAVEESAQRGRWEFEPGLVDQLLHDVGHEPGALPLLSHALLETWHRRRGRTMTLSGYASSHGVRGAIAETAEAVFTDQFTREQQAIARRIFLRLTELGDEASAGDTRRRATITELILKPEDAATTHAVLKALADARLITTSEDSAEVAHEALIREWPTLRGWLEENREGLRLHRQLTEAGQEWLGADRPPDVLYRGTRLAQAREWASTHEAELNAMEREFLTASIEASEREIQEREAQRQRELESIRKLAASERRRAEEQVHTASQLRKRAYYLGGILVLAIISALTAGVFANRSSALATQNAAIAATAQADFTRSDAQRLAAVAMSLRRSVADPQLIALLSLRSINTQYTVEGDVALIEAASLPLPQVIFTGHTKGVYSVVFSPDGEYVLTGSYDGIARLFDAHTGKDLRQFTGHDAGVRAVFSPDGRSILMSSQDGTAEKRDAATGEILQRYPGSTDGLTDVRLSPDGKRVLTASLDGTAQLWDAETGAPLCRYVGHTDQLRGAAFSPDGQYVATTSIDQTARLWKTENCELLHILSGHTDELASVDFSPDGRTVVTGSWDHTARLWDVETGQELRQFIGHGYWVNSVRFSPDGRFLLTGSADKTAILWDVQTGQGLHQFSGHTDFVLTVAFSPDGRYILTAGHDKTAWLWDLQKVYGEHPRFIGHTNSVYGVAFSPDGLHLVTGGADNTARLWDTQTGTELHTFAGHSYWINSVALSPDGRYLLTGSLDASAWLWDVHTGGALNRFAHDPGGVSTVAFTPDGRYALTGGWDGTARLWDTQTGQLRTTYGASPECCGGPYSFYGVAISPNGQYVLTGGYDGVMRLWDTQSGRELHQFTGHTDKIYGVAFSPDGRLALSAGNDKTARLWDVQTGQELQRLIGHTAYLYSVAFSPDGKLALTGGADNTARLWDLQTGREVRRFIGHTGSVEWAVFSPDGKVFVAASDDGTARVWDVDYRDTMRYLCSHLSRDFTDAERVQYDIMDSLPTCPNQ